MQIAERTITYRKYEIFGRHIIDTWILAQHYDVATRELESFGLKDVARHFGIAGAERTYVPSDKTSWYFDHDPDTLFRYALDDVRETRAISEILSSSYFVAGANFSRTATKTSRCAATPPKSTHCFCANICTSAAPCRIPTKVGDVIGGFTQMEYQGTAQRVLHCDVTSLYPSLMLVYNYLPKKDELGVFAGLLRDLRSVPA